MSSGRSPYATRSRRRLQQQEQQQPQPNDGTAAASRGRPSLGVEWIDTSVSNATSASTSPRHSMGSTTSFRLGQSLVQARLSPRVTPKNNTTGTSGAPSSERHFFSGGPSAKTPANAVQNSASNHHDQTPATSAPGDAVEASNPKDWVDGMDLEYLRRLAAQSLTQAQMGSVATFYASTVYAKTQSPEDALLYARTLLYEPTASSATDSSLASPKRVVRLLEQAGLLTFTSTTMAQVDLHLILEAVLLATQALAMQDEWQGILHILEDNHLYDAIRWHGEQQEADEAGLFGQPSHAIQDDDDIAWQQLQHAISANRYGPVDGETKPNAAEIHPLAKICGVRAQAYAKLGHPLRAAIFYKKALQIDPQYVVALEGLLDADQLINAQEAHEFIVHHLQFPPHLAWLRAFYLARVHVAAPTSTAAASGNQVANNNKTLSEDTFWQDSSSLQLLTPIPKAADEGHPGDIHRKHDESCRHPQEEELEGALDALLNDYHLEHSADVLAMAAQRAYRQSRLPQALRYCQELEKVDPLCTKAAHVHVSTCVALGHKRTLFRLAHEWVDAAPKSSRAWFAVGAYYFACGRFHVAQKHFCRATRLDPQNAEAWIAFGTSFAACEESDQALASFRAAQRLAPGDDTSLLYIGMEYIRTNHSSLAEHFLKAAYRISKGTNRLCSNEMGVWHLNSREYEEAAEWFVRALREGGGSESMNAHADTAVLNSAESLSQLLDTIQDSYWEPTIFNLAHALRKLRQFDLAILCLERCLTLKPSSNASAWSALGFCQHMQGDLDIAIDTYHQALAHKPEDPFASEMLQRALQDALSRTTEMFDSIGLADPAGESHAATTVTKVRNVPVPGAVGRESMGASSMMTDGGLSISVESGSVDDIDMG